MKISTKYKACFLLSLISITSCSLDVKYENQFSDPDAITNVATARELLASAYNEIPLPELDLSILSDDFTTTYWTRSNSSLLNQYNWQPAAIQALASSYWNAYYSVVASVNTLLERLPYVETSDEQTLHERNSIKAEALSLKAMCYFNLLRLFAPDYADGCDLDGIVLKDKVEMENLPRKSIRECAEAIRSLLRESLTLNPNDNNTVWLNADACLYLLAELELYCGNFNDAIDASGIIISRHGEQALSEQDYARLWRLEDSEEEIFSYVNPKQCSSFYVPVVYDKYNGDYFEVSHTLADSYHPSDIRYTESVYQTDSPSLGVMRYVGKYNKLRKEGLDITKIHKLRLSGAYFILAEAAWHIGDSDRARNAINTYLSARCAEPIPSDVTRAELLTAILREKQKEFVGEGQRFFDLKHYRLSVLREWTKSQPAERRIQPDDHRWTFPIPKEEYLYNDNISQNKGWELS